MELSIVILNWNVRDLLRRCLNSVYENAPDMEFEVIVVDNASADGSAAMVAAEFPQAELIASNVNLGFAGGNNLGLERARGEFVLLLNPDTEVRGDALGRMVRAMRAVPEAAVLGPKLVNPDGTLQRSVRGLPTFGVLALMMLKLHNVLRRLPMMRRYFAADFDYSAAQEAGQVMGAAFLMRRGALEELGPLDPRYFIWFEEVDWCRMARDAGYEVRYDPSAVIIHRGGESFGQVRGTVNQRRLNDSLLKYARKHFGVAAWAALACLWPLSMALAWMVEAFPALNRLKPKRK